MLRFTVLCLYLIIFSNLILDNHHFVKELELEPSSKMEKPTAASPLPPVEQLKAENINSTRIHNNKQANDATAPTISQIDPPSTNFVGRQSYIEQIDRIFQNSSIKTSTIERIVLIHGLEGMGKSELIRMYHAHKNVPKQHQGQTEDQGQVKDLVNYQNVAWIWIDSENIDRLTASFIRLANKLDLPTESKGINEIVNEVYTDLSKYPNQRWVFIFDNAPQLMKTDAQFGIFDFLPSEVQTKDQHFFILVTTTDSRSAVESEWELIPHQNKVKLDPLSDEETLEYLLKFIKLNSKSEIDEMKLIRRLARSLRGYPLALNYVTLGIQNANSLQFAIIFAAKVLQSELRYRRFQDFDSIYELLQKLKTIIEHGSNEINEATMDLFFMTFYWFSYREPYRSREIFKNVELKENMERVFVKYGEPFLEALFFPNATHSVLNYTKNNDDANSVDIDATSLSEITDRLSKRLCYGHFFKRNTLPRKYLLERMNIEKLISTSDSSSTKASYSSNNSFLEGDELRVKSSYLIYQLLWGFHVELEDPESAVVYMKGVVKKHNDLSRILKQTSSKEILSAYWVGQGRHEERGPLWYHQIDYYIYRREHPAWCQKFADSFFAEGGPLIMIEQLQFFITLDTVPEAYRNLLVVIGRLAFDLQSGKKFLEFPGFMETLYKFTEHAFELQSEYVEFLHAELLTTWFALFPKNEAFQESGSGREWSMDVVEKHVQWFHTKVLHKGITYCISQFYQRKVIFSTFVDATKTRKNSIARNYAEFLLQSEF